MLTVPILLIWLFSIIIFSVLAYIAGYRTRIIEIKQNEEVKEIKFNSSDLEFEEEEEAFVPGVDDVQNKPKRNIQYKTVDEHIWSD